MESLVALSLAAAVVRFVDAGDKLVPLAAVVQQQQNLNYHQFLQLSQCLKDLRGLALSETQDHVKDGKGLDLTSTRSPDEFLMDYANLAKRQAILICNSLQKVRNIIKSAPPVPESWLYFQRGSKKNKRLWPRELDHHIPLVSKTLASLWESQKVAIEIARVCQHRGKLNSILLQIVNTNVSIFPTPHLSELSTARQPSQSPDDNITQILSLNLHKSLQSVAALATKRNGEVISLVHHDSSGLKDNTTQAGNIIKYHALSETPSRPATDEGDLTNSDSDRRIYGNTTLSGSAVAHLGDTNFTAPIHIHQLVLSDTNHHQHRANHESGHLDSPRKHSPAGYESYGDPGFLTGSASGRPAQELESVQIQPPSLVVDNIIELLDFDEESYRISDVKEAHRRTFGWVFSLAGPHEPQNFAEWMHSGQKIFWINGKAGSGKSTLMKYILRSSRSRHYLSQWAGTRHLLMVPFFFWHLGTSLQKSYEGILRSLLMQVLEQRPNLATVLFPEIYVHLLSNRKDSLAQIGLRELQAATENLTKGLPNDIALFIMVDGIDEYSGDYFEFSKFLVRLCDNPAIKILASSRPIPACHHVFSRFPSLRVQDLTTDDVKHYIEDELIKDELLQDANSMYPGLAHRIQEELTDKASGVFLWIILVVKDLLTGLSNYDTPDKLLERINVLPSDLEDLYDHMFAKMPSDYQEEGSTLLQLTKRAVSEQGTDYTALQASFADLALSKSLPQTPSSASGGVDILRVKAVEGRLRSRCCGLIEVQYNRKAQDEEPRVNFLHRTVFEYLSDNGVWERVKSLKAWTMHDIDMILLRSCVQNIRYSSNQPLKCLGRLFRGICCYSRKISLAGSDSYVEQMHTADQTLMDVCAGNVHAFDRYHSYNEVYRSLHAPDLGAVIVPSTKDKIDTTTIFFATFGLPTFWRQKLEEISQDSDPEKRGKILLRVLAALSHSNSDVIKKSIQNLEILLESVDPNFVVRDERALSYFEKVRKSLPRYGKPSSVVPWHFWVIKKWTSRSIFCWQVTLLLIRAGANLDWKHSAFDGLVNNAMDLQNTGYFKNEKDAKILDEIMYWLGHRSHRDREDGLRESPLSPSTSKRTSTPRSERKTSSSLSSTPKPQNNLPQIRERGSLPSSSLTQTSTPLHLLVPSRLPQPSYASVSAPPPDTTTSLVTTSFEQLELSRSVSSSTANSLNNSTPTRFDGLKPCRKLKRRSELKIPGRDQEFL